MARCPFETRCHLPRPHPHHKSNSLGRCHPTQSPTELRHQFDSEEVPRCLFGHSAPCFTGLTSREEWWRTLRFNASQISISFSCTATAKDAICFPLSLPSSKITWLCSRSSRNDLQILDMFHLCVSLLAGKRSLNNFWYQDGSLKVREPVRYFNSLHLSTQGKPPRTCNFQGLGWNPPRSAVNF